MSNEGEFKIKITGDASSLVGASEQSHAALKGLTNQTKEAAPAVDQLRQKTEESAKSSEHAGISHRALHLIFRQVGEASKGLEVGLMALSGVMMGSVTFGIYAVVAGIQALIAHFEKQRQIALEAAKATVQFWTDALKGKEDARKAAEDYAGALHKIITNVDTLKQREGEEEAVLRLRRGYGEARRTVWCKVGGTGDQRLGCLGCHDGFGWVAETRETGKAPELGHHLARNPSGKPSNHSIGKSEEPGFAF